ncbi:MAG: ABC transporter permease [Parvibaculaceae bacterium]
MTGLQTRIVQVSDVCIRFCSRVLVIATVFIMLSPVLIVALLSFSNQTFMEFPPTEWGFRQYVYFVSADEWIDAVKLSFVIGAGASILAIAVAVPAVMALYRTAVPGQATIAFAATVPLLIPHVAYAVGMYGVIADAGLVATRTGLILSHVAITFPLIFLLVSAGIMRISEDLELVAMTLGSSRIRAWIGITLRLLLPAIGSGALLAFVTSFDEAVFASFLGGPGLVTLPKAIFDSVLLGVDPVITAIATILIFSTGAVIGCASWLQRR